MWHRRRACTRARCLAVLHPTTRELANAETAARIDEIIADLNYRPNVIARGLRMQQTRLVAVISPDLMNPVFPAIIRGIEDRLQASGYVVLLVNTDNDPEREREAFDAMRQRQVDGIIAATAVQGNTAIPELLEDGVAIVLVNRSLPRSKVPAVVPDDRDGMRQSVDYVIRLGHERIAHLAGPRPVPNSAERRRGFIAAMKRAGQSTDAPIAEASRYAIEDGERAASMLLDRRPRPTAILAANDLLAIGAYRAAAARGLEVPRDVSIVGFNDMPFVDQFRPPLTTVRIPHRELGRRAADLLLAALDTASSGGDPPQGKVRLPLELVERKLRALATPKELGASGGPTTPPPRRANVTPPSGIGREGGRWSRDFFTAPKAFVMRFP